MCKAGARRQGGRELKEERSLDSNLGVSRILGFHIKLLGLMNYFPNFEKCKEQAAWDKFYGVGWWVFVFQYNTFSSIWR